MLRKMPKPYPRRRKLWFSYLDPLEAKWVSRSTGFDVGKEASAQRFIDQFIVELHEAAAGEGAALTVAAWAARWIERRRALGVATVNDEEARLRLHVLPRIGALLLTAIRPKHIAAVITELRIAGALSPRSIHHVYGHLHTMFAAARREELIETNPVDLERGVLPQKTDKDPTWRHEAIFARDEVELLLGDPRVLGDRQVLYGLKGLAGLRHNEAATLRWADVDTAAQPLGKILLGKTKSRVPRAIPVHPLLAAMLAEWRIGGWGEMMGRPPRRDDLVVPTRNGRVRDPNDAQDGLLHDLGLLELRTAAGADRKRRGHDLRRTLITMLLEAGARRDIIEWFTHGPRGDIISVYTQLPWPVVCAEMLKLQIGRRRGADVLPLHTPLHASGRHRNHSGKDATPTGFEPIARAAKRRQTADRKRADDGLNGSSEAIRVVGPLHAVLEELTTGNVAGAVSLVTEIIERLEGRAAAGSRP